MKFSFLALFVLIASALFGSMSSPVEAQGGDYKPYKHNRPHKHYKHYKLYEEYRPYKGYKPYKYYKKEW